MDTFKNFKSKIYNLRNQSFSDELALDLFRFQAVHNELYSSFLDNLGVRPHEVNNVLQIPFLPISFFKSHTIQTGKWNVEQFFTSSGTTGQLPSKHAVREVDFYLHHSKRCFEFFFGSLTNYHFLALLPSYLERQGSSLIAMLDFFIRDSGSSHSGFYLANVEKLLEDIDVLRSESRKIILWGVSFALLDLAEKHRIDLSHCILVETGGMKGRRREMIRKELHDRLKSAFSVPLIYSEYGMTELFSQAYTAGEERFMPSPWMKIIGRDITDPLTKGLLTETSGINVIDLANIDSVAFIETEDLGKVYEDGSFEVLGRLDNSDARGCNLMLLT